MAGQNTDALLAEENRRYEESISALEASQAEQEAAQQKSLGRMVLNHFNAWVEMNLASDGFTKEEAAYVSRMRMEIAEEYGLISEHAIGKMESMESKWNASMAVMRGDASGFFDFFIQQFNALPSEKIIRIRTELSTPDVADPDRLGGETRQHGGPVHAGRPYLVGERGPEMFVPGSSGYVYNSNDTYNLMSAPAAAMAITGKRRAHLARLM